MGLELAGIIVAGVVSLFDLGVNITTLVFSGHCRSSCCDCCEFEHDEHDEHENK
jgi:hypothetical protein